MDKLISPFHVFRIAAILQGVYKRSLSKQENAPKLKLIFRRSLYYLVVFFFFFLDNHYNNVYVPKSFFLIYKTLFIL